MEQAINADTTGTNANDADTAQRAACGRFEQGKPGPALKTGARSALVKAGALPEQAEAVAAMQERRAIFVADLGGDLSQLQADTLERYQQACLVADYLFDNIARLGALTGKGRTRAAVSAYLRVLDRQVRLAQLLGIERRARKVGDLTGYIRENYGDGK